MAWPQSQEYNEAIQNPSTCFKDPDLKGGSPALNALGVPLPCSGNFADVYQLTSAGGTRWAVKCFTRGEPASLRRRYAEIDAHLQKARLPFAVGFQFLDQGIRVKGAWHPVLKMQWVEGLTLNQFVRERLDRPALLEALLQIWARMGRRLREADLAHADLQHGNVLLVPGASANALGVKLIDYDGMWVPALSGQQSGEVGHPAYQHPQRLKDGTYTAEVDRFPLLVVATALRCLSVGGKALWEKYDNGDNLLFREEDFKAPVRSPLFAELWKLTDPQARLLLGKLEEACKRPLEQAPHLDELLAEASPVTARKPAAAAAPTVQPEGSLFAGIGEPGPALGSRRRRGGAGLVPWVVGVGCAVAALVMSLVLLGPGDKKDSPDSPEAAEGPVQPDPPPDRPVDPPVNPKKDDPPVEPKKTDPPPPRRVTVGKLDDLTLSAGDTGELFVPVAGTERADRLRTELLDLPAGVTARRVGLDPRRRGWLWKLSASDEADAADQQVRVVVSAGEVQAQGRFRLKVERTVVRRPDPPPVAPPEFPAREVARFKETGPFLGVSFSPDGRRALAYTSSTIVLFDPTTGEVKDKINYPGPVHGAAWLPDNRRFVWAAVGWELEIRDAETRKSRRDFEGRPSKNVALAVSPDGRRIATTVHDPAAPNSRPGVHVYEVETRKLIRRFDALIPDSRQLAFTPDGNGLLVCSPPPHSRRALLDVETGKVVRELRGTDPRQSQNCLAMAPDGKHAAFGASEGLLHRDLQADQDVRLVADTDVAVHGCAYSPDGRTLIAGVSENDEKDCSVRVWEVATGNELHRLEGHPRPVRGVALSPDGRSALTAGDDQTVRVWDLRPGVRELPPGDAHQWVIPLRETRRMEQGEQAARGVACSPDGTRAVGWGKELVVWDVDSGGRRKTWPGKGPVGATAFLPDGHIVLTHGKTIEVWDPEGGESREVGSQKSPVAALAVSADGKRAVSVGADLRVWTWRTARSWGPASREARSAGSPSLPTAVAPCTSTPKPAPRSYSGTPKRAESWRA